MFLKNKNIIFKIRRSKVTDYAALKPMFPSFVLLRIKIETITSSDVLNFIACEMLVLCCFRRKVSVSLHQKGW